MKILHMSLDTFNSNFSQTDLSNTVIISFAKGLKLKEKYNVLYLKKILEGDFNPLPFGYKHFNKKDAKKIFNFLDNKSFNTIYCVCDIGICRSFSVAISLCYTYNLDYKNYMLNNNGYPDKNIITCLTNENFFNEINTICKSKPKNLNLNNLFN